MPPLANRKLRNAGDAYRVVGDWTPGNYVTGGNTITPADCGLPASYALEYVDAPAVGATRLYEALKQADGTYKIKAYTAINTELGNGVAVGATLRLRVEGGPVSP